MYSQNTLDPIRRTEAFAKRQRILNEIQSFNDKSSTVQVLVNEPSYVKDRSETFRNFVEYTTTERNKALGESMSIFKPAMFRDIPDRIDPIRQTADALNMRQIGQDLVTGKLRPYEL